MRFELCCAIALATVASSAKIEAMVPWGGRACISLARSATKPQTVLERVDPGAIGRGKLSDAVAQHNIGNHAP